MSKLLMPYITGGVRRDWTDCLAAFEDAGADMIEVGLPASSATPDDRLAEIGRRSQGFVYAVSVMGTTGERDRLAPSAAALAARVKQVTPLPVLLGFGISTPGQAAEAAAAADGVVV